MLLQKEGVEISEFILDDNEAYIITYEDSSFWTVDVSRRTGLVGFIKGTILPESVDKFEASYDGQKTKVYINYTDANGSLRREYAGETK